MYRCTVSLPNLFSDNGPADIADLLINTIDLAFHPNLMGAAGDLAVQTLKEATAGNFILAIDGGIPTAFNGHTCTLWTENGHDVTAKEAVLSLAPKAAAILGIGANAVFLGCTEDGFAGRDISEAVKYSWYEDSTNTPGPGWECRRRRAEHWDTGFKLLKTKSHIIRSSHRFDFIMEEDSIEDISFGDRQSAFRGRGSWGACSSRA